MSTEKHSAMSSRMAKMLCPHAVFLKGNMDEYSKASNEITEILRERVPLIEKASIDEHYIDMTGMDRFHSTLQYAHELKQTVIREMACPYPLVSRSIKRSLKWRPMNVNQMGNSMSPKGKYNPF